MDVMQAEGGSVTVNIEELVATVQSVVVSAAIESWRHFGPACQKCVAWAAAGPLERHLNALVEAVQSGGVGNDDTLGVSLHRFIWAEREPSADKLGGVLHLYATILVSVLMELQPCAEAPEEYIDSVKAQVDKALAAMFPGGLTPRSYPKWTVSKFSITVDRRVARGTVDPHEVEGPPQDQSSG